MKIESGQVWNNRSGPGGNQQVVIGYLDLLVVGPDGSNQPLPGIDGLGPMPGHDLDAQFFLENFGRSHDQIIHLSMGIGYIVGHAAGAVGDIPGLFDDHYLGSRIKALGSAGGTHSGGVSTDDDQFHVVLTFWVV